MKIERPLSRHMARALRAYESWTYRLGRSRPAARYGVAVASTAIVTAVMKLSGLAFAPANISIIYLLAVLFAATIAGLGPGITGSILSFLAYNFFFVEPLYILTVASPQDVLRLVTFLVAAILASSLAGLVHKQADLLRQRAAELGSLYTLSQTTSAELELDRILPVFATTAMELLQVRSCTIIVCPGAQDLTNLIENALKYTPEGTPLTLSAEVHGDESGRISSTGALESPPMRCSTSSISLLAPSVPSGTPRASDWVWRSARGLLRRRAGKSGHAIGRKAEPSLSLRCHCIL